VAKGFSQVPGLDCCLQFSPVVNDIAFTIWLTCELKKRKINCTVENDLTETLFDKSRTKAWLGQPHVIKKLRALFADKISHLKSHATPDIPGQTICRPKEGDPVLDEEMVSAGQLCDLRTRPVHVASRTAIYGFSTITDDATALR